MACRLVSVNLDKKSKAAKPNPGSEGCPHALKAKLNEIPVNAENTSICDNPNSFHTIIIFR